MAATPDFKLLLVGDSGVGKTAFLRRLCSDQFELRYVSMSNVETRLLVISTTCGRFLFNCWDIHGSDAFNSDERRGYYTQGQCAIIMFDVASRITFQNVATWYDEVVRVCENIPIVLCGNKADVGHRRSRVKEIRFTRTCSLPYFEISAYSDSDEELRAPLTWLVRQLTGDTLATVVDCPRYCLPEVHITPDQIALLEEENAATAAAVPLPDEDEDL